MQEEFLSYGEQLEARGWAAVVLMILGLRFGDILQPVQQRVESASTEELVRWAKQLLTAESLTKVFEP